MIQRLKRVHHTLAHLQRLDLPLPGGTQAMLDLLQLSFYALDGDGALLLCLQLA